MESWGRWLKDFWCYITCMLLMGHWQFQVTYVACIYLHALALASDKEQLPNKAFKTNSLWLLEKPLINTCIILKLIKCTSWSVLHMVNSITQVACQILYISMCSCKDLNSTYKQRGYLFIYSFYSFIHFFNTFIEHSLHASDWGHSDPNGLVRVPDSPGTLIWWHNSCILFIQGIFMCILEILENKLLIKHSRCFC